MRVLRNSKLDLVSCAIHVLRDTCGSCSFAFSLISLIPAAIFVFVAVFACRSPSPSADSLVERFQFFYSDLLGKCKCVRSQRESESASNYCYCYQ